MTIWLFLETSISWMLGCSKIFGCRKNQPHGFSGKGFGLCCDTWPSWMVPWVTTWWQVLVMGCEWWQVVKWISKSSDHPKTFKWMFFLGLSWSIYFPARFFFQKCFWAFSSPISPSPAPQLQAPAFCWSPEKFGSGHYESLLLSPGRNVNTYVRVYALKCGGDLSK